MKRIFVLIAVALAIGMTASAATPVVIVDNGGSIIRPVFAQYTVAYDDNRILNDTATSASAITTTTTFLAQPVSLSRIIITPGGTTADVPAGDITVIGTDYAGTAQTEAVTLTANQSTVATTTAAFATITSIAFPIQDGAGATYDVGVAGAVALTVAPADNFVIIGLKVHLSAAGGTASESLVVTMDADAGSTYDVVLFSQDMELVTDLVQVYDTPIPCEDGDELEVEWANANNRTWGIEVIYELRD